MGCLKCLNTIQRSQYLRAHGSHAGGKVIVWSYPTSDGKTKKTHVTSPLRGLTTTQPPQRNMRVLTSESIYDISM